MKTTTTTTCHFFIVLLFGPFSLAQAAERPNIVYIMADELGYYEPSYMGNPNIKTPRIDQMARGGIYFTQALAGCSVCAPTRCALMTGKHMGHASVRANGGGTPLRADDVTFASMLKKRGYATGGFGKWGCGGRGSTGVPEKHGFDEFVGYYDQVHAHSYYPKYIIHNSKELPLADNVGGSKGKTYSHYIIFDRAKKFIRRNKDRPFFCYLPITPPHGLFDIPDSDPAWQIYKDKKWPMPARRYAAMVSMVDRHVGEVLDLLKDLRLQKKTIVFFCGDNGGADYFRDKDHPRGFHGANVHPQTGVQFRGRKGTLYEGGLRVPMVVYWPGRIEPKRKSDLLWYFPDVFPTVCELTGASMPPGLDGISIVPELLGESVIGRKQKQHDYLYWEMSGQVAIRKKNWKAVKPLNNRWELYDLAQDVSEKNNLATRYPRILADLQRLAKEAHTPVRPGTFNDRAAHERDRRAKWGDLKRPQRRRVNRLRKKGLIPNRGWKIVSVSSESKFNRKLARMAIDGKPRTHWHSKFRGAVAKHPHEIVIDLGRARTITAFRYLARQDNGWNGAIKKCEFYVSDSPQFDKPTLVTEFRKTKKSQQAKCPQPVIGRYIKLRILSDVDGRDFASISELGVVGR